MWKVLVPLTVWIVKSVCGWDSRNRQIQLTHITHQVTPCAPYPVGQPAADGAQHAAGQREAGRQQRGGADVQAVPPT